ncbi:hypothetical protein GCM10009038_02920 [Salinicola rhizosphaerae]|uniref:Uncharacterized protein n=1 Tax=Salinicola rhizosphaerae TaxID=1443141 RepID=A0ABQ3DPA9_9GAMM|nr:hypothetical protein GCM10009038_02920 [Salinicola rhizosphaerae]
MVFGVAQAKLIDRRDVGSRLGVEARVEFGDHMIVVHDELSFEESAKQSIAVAGLQARHDLGWCVGPGGGKGGWE